MIEAEWLACTNPDVLLEHLDGKATDRKLRLYGCACCRRIWNLFTDERSKTAIEVAERFADGNATKEELAVAHKAAVGLIWATTGMERDMAHAASWVATPHAWDAADATGRVAAKVVALATGREEAINVERGEQLKLLREIMGNPFQAVRLSQDPPPEVLAVARSLYAGADRRFTLQTVLEEAGLKDLAQHFAAGTHPKGCWALDTILDKT